MTQKQLKSILERLKYWQAESDKWQKAFSDLSKTIAPSSYPPIIEDRFVEGFIDGVCFLHPELKEDLEYFLYEASPESKITFKKKTYHCNIVEYSNFLYDYHYK